MTGLIDAPVGVLVVCALVGIAAAALLSAGEVALVSASRSGVADLAQRSPHKAARLNRLVDNSTQVAAVASFARIFGEMVSTTCITIALATLFDSWWLVIGVSVVVSAAIALLIVRVSPRTVGRYNSVGVLGVLSGLLAFTYAALKWVAPMSKAARIPASVDNQQQFKAFVDRVEESDVIEAEERQMLRSVIQLHGTLLKEVMVPRPDIISIKADVSLDKAQRLFVRSGFSRVPVIGETIEDVVGVLFFKDAARVLLNSHDPQSRTVADIMRPIKFYPETKPADDLLRDMQATHQHIAMAVDEYGGIAGMVTIEDILEEIVGEMVDEHDKDVQGFEVLSEDTYRVPARMPLDDLSELLDVELEDPDVDTIAGLLAKLLGKIPLAGAEIEHQGLRLAADQFGGRRKQLSSVIIEKISSQLPDEPVTPGEQGTEPAGTTPSDQFGSGQAEQDKQS